MAKNGPKAGGLRGSLARGSAPGWTGQAHLHPAVVASRLVRLTWQGLFCVLGPGLAAPA